MHGLIPLLVEPAMYFGIGFLLAALLSLPFMGAIHRRAVRLTVRDRESRRPSVDELRAQNDGLRSEFAAATTRLQSTLDDVKGKAAAHRAEVGRQATVVRTLKDTLGDKARTIAALEAREVALRNRLETIEREHARKSLGLDDARRALAGKAAELAHLTAALGDRDAIADHQNVELARTRVNVEALKATVDGLNDELTALGTRLDQARDDSATATRELAEERGKVANLGRRIGDLGLELIAQRNGAVALGRVAADRLADQARLLAARDDERDRLRGALDGAQRTEAALRYEFAQAEERRLLERKAALAEKAALEVAIGQLKQDCAYLQEELRTLQRDAVDAHAIAQVESASMREHVNEVQVSLLRPAFDPAAPRPA